MVLILLKQRLNKCSEPNDLWRDTMSLVLRTHHNILRAKEQWELLSDVTQPLEFVVP